LPKNSCSAIIGSGIEENPMAVDLAGPRGICNGTIDGRSVIFIADSNSSSIRVVTLSNGQVTYLIGGDLEPTHRLQYPTGLAYHNESSRLFFTDTFNNNIKVIDITTRNCSTFLVSDVDLKKQRGETNAGQFNEPCGLTISEHFMWVVDKNNGQVKRIDLNQKTIVRVSRSPALAMVFDGFSSHFVFSIVSVSHRKNGRSLHDRRTFRSNLRITFDLIRTRSAAGRSKIKVS
jgi:hypothetical protein